MTTEPYEEQQYLDLLADVMANGADKQDRTGTGTKAVFGRQMRFDPSRGLPLLTTKKLHIRSIVIELLWFLRGDTNIRWLQDRKVSIWDEWADENGDLGPVYGKQWRRWETPDGKEIDQISDLISIIRNDADSRRQLVTSWNPADNPKMALTPCHCIWQTFVADGKLSLQLFQRSADTFIGLPFNITSYALLTHMLAQQCDLEVGELVWTGGDVHLYSNHFEQAATQIARVPTAPPTLSIRQRPDTIFDYDLDDFEIVGYEAQPHIRAPIAV